MTVKGHLTAFGGRRKPKLLERDIERTCSEFLAIDGWRCLKTDPVSDQRRGKGFGEVGMADCLYIRYKDPICKNHSGRHDLICSPVHAELVWIEWKRPKGKVSQHQLDWHVAERARGALTLIAGVDFPASIDGFQEFYHKSGLARRVLAKAEPSR